MAAFLKQSTAVTVTIGPFLDATDGVSEETGLSPAVELSKAGGAFASASTGTTAHLAEGWYDCDLDATDTGTLGRLVLKAHDSANHLPVWHEFMVVPAHVYDGLVAGTDNLQVDTVQIEGVDATNQINAEVDSAFADYDPPTNAEMEARTLAAAAYFDPTSDTVDVGKINGSANAAARLALSAAQMIPGTVSTGTTAASTTVFAASDITEATADHYNDRLVLWTSGALIGQVTNATDYELVSGEGKFTVTTMTDTPSNGDSFLLV